MIIYKKFNIYEFLKTRPLSWSAISSFEWNPEQWFDTYILGNRQTSKEMTFGSFIDKQLEENPAFMPHIIRYPIRQHKMCAKLGKIPLIGIADTVLLPSGPLARKTAVRDYKTGKKAWDQKRADETGQLTFYGLLLWLCEGIKAEEIDFYIDWMPTQEGGDFAISLIDDTVVRTFHTKRTMVQVLMFGKRIQDTVKAMELYANSKI